MLHSRIDDRVQHITDRIEAGNIYVNRNQIGAVVGSQPFGGEGLSGTGPKAGGPNYLSRFYAPDRQHSDADWQHSQDGLPIPSGTPAAPTTQSLPCPTGESNRLTLTPRPPLLCLGPGPDAVVAQMQEVTRQGGTALQASGRIDLQQLQQIQNMSGVLWWGDAKTGRAIEQALAMRDGPILPLIPGHPDRAHVLGERHICVDTTAAGGNAALLGGEG